MGKFWQFWLGILKAALLSFLSKLDDVIGVSVAVLLVAGIAWLVWEVIRQGKAGFRIWCRELMMLVQKKLETKLSRFFFIGIVVVLVYNFVSPLAIGAFQEFAKSNATITAQAEMIGLQERQIGLVTFNARATELILTKQASELPPTATDLPPVEQDKLEIMELIDKFLYDLDQERLPDDWDVYLDSAYRNIYLETHGGVDGLSQALHGKGRHVFRYGEFYWDDNGMFARVPVEIRVGYGVDFIPESFFFDVKWNDNINHWTIVSDKFTQTPSTPTPISD